MYIKLDETCPYCRKKKVFKCTYAGCEEEIYVECENCWTVIREEAA